MSKPDTLKTRIQRLEKAERDAVMRKAWREATDAVQSRLALREAYGRRRSA